MVTQRYTVNEEKSDKLHLVARIVLEDIEYDIKTCQSKKGALKMNFGHRKVNNASSVTFPL